MQKTMFLQGKLPAVEFIGEKRMNKNGDEEIVPVRLFAFEERQLLTDDPKLISMLKERGYEIWGEDHSLSEKPLQGHGKK